MPVSVLARLKRNRRAQRRQGPVLVAFPQEFLFLGGSWLSQKSQELGKNAAALPHAAAPCVPTHLLPGSHLGTAVELTASQRVEDGASNAARPEMMISCSKTEKLPGSVSWCSRAKHPAAQPFAELQSLRQYPPAELARTGTVHPSFR